MMLLTILMPGHLLFIWCISALEGTGSPTPLFLLLYLAAAFLQVSFLSQFLIELLVTAFVLALLLSDNGLLDVVVLL